MNDQFSIGYRLEKLEYQMKNIYNFIKAFGLDPDHLSDDDLRQQAISYAEENFRNWKPETPLNFVIDASLFER